MCFDLTFPGSVSLQSSLQVSPAMKSLLLAAAAALSLGFAAPADAGEMVPIATAGPWEIFGNETLCRAQSDFQNGTTLYFYINAQNGVSIGIFNLRWQIPKGSYEVLAWIDRTNPGRMTATGHGAGVHFGIVGSEGDLNLLAHGRTLYVTIGTQTYQYNLNGSALMLTAMAACAATRPAAANPYDGAPQASAPPTNPFPETPSSPYRRM
jgi:hypothetical protein